MFYISVKLLFIITTLKETLCDSVKPKDSACSVCKFSNEALDCSYKNIRLIRLNCTNLEKLKVLYLNNNNITDIKSDTFTGLKNLYRLSLDNNTLGVIKKDTFKSLTKLRYLHLSKNKMKQIEDYSFQHLTQLRFIDLESNQLTTIKSKSLGNCSYLSHVYLTKNKIKKIQVDSFRKSPNVQLLYSSQNKISNIDFLKYLPNLVYLDLSLNYIKEIPPNLMTKMTCLKKLNLYSNDLQIINSGTFSRLQALEAINLSGNKLKYLGEELFDYLNKLNSLDVRNNLLQRFSYSGDFKKRNFSLQIFVDYNNWQCSFIYQILQFLWIKLKYYNVNKNVSNVNGIPCQNEIMYQTSTTTKKMLNLTTATRIPKEHNLYTSASLTYVTEIVTDVDFTNITTNTVEPTTIRTNQQLITKVTLPEMKIQQSLLITISLGVLILVAVIILLSRKLTNTHSICCTNPHLTERHSSKEDYLVPRHITDKYSSNRSKFYVTLESYNTYEEIHKIDTENYYEEIV